MDDKRPTAQLQTIAAPDPVIAMNEPALDGSDAEAYAKLKARRAERRRRKLIRRGIIGGVGVAVLAIGGVGLHLLTHEPEVEQTPVTETAMRGDYIDDISAKGKLQAISSTVITPEVDGTIATVNVMEGQQVDKGDTLFTIKSDELDRAVADAQRGLKEAKAAQAAAYKAYNAEVDAYNAAISQPVEDPSLLPSKPDDSTLVSVDNSVASAQATLDDANAQAAKRTVTAPCAGSIVSMNAQVGAGVSDSVSQGKGALMQIADLSQMKVTVQVGEEDIARVVTEQKATVSFPAYEGLELEGSVTGIAQAASTDGDVYSYDGSASVTFAVDVLIPAPDARLKPGMTAQVKIVAKELNDVVMVPVSALLTDDGETYYVNVVSDLETMAAERRDITVIAKNDEFAVVGKPSDAGADANADMVTAPIEDGDTLLISGGSVGDASLDGAVTEEF